MLIIQDIPSAIEHSIRLYKKASFSAGTVFLTCRDFIVNNL